MSSAVRITQRTDPSRAERQRALREQRRQMEIAYQNRRAGRQAQARSTAVHRGARLAAASQRDLIVEAAREARRREHEQQRSMREQLRATSQAEAAPLNRSALTEISMTWNRWDDVLTVAGRLGFEAAEHGAVVDPRTGVPVETDLVLTHQDGTVVGLARAADGATWVVSEAADLEARFVNPVAQGVGVLRTVTALRAQGMRVELRELPDGEVQIEAVRDLDGRREGMLGRVTRDGCADLEVLGIKGPRCEQLVENVSKSIEGEVVHRRRTSEFFEQPLMQPKAARAVHNG